jgi:hypothetical protein
MMKGNIIILKVLLATGVTGESVSEGHSKKQNIKIDVTNTYSFLFFLIYMFEQSGSKIIK